MSVVLKRAIEVTLVNDSFIRRAKYIQIAKTRACPVRDGDVYELQILENHTESNTSAAQLVYSLGLIKIETNGTIERGNRVWVGNDFVGNIIGFASQDLSYPAVLISSDKRNPVFDIHWIINKRICFDSTFFTMI